jgi:hypothetical protein
MVIQNNGTQSLDSVKESGESEAIVGVKGGGSGGGGGGGGSGGSFGNTVMKKNVLASKWHGLTRTTVPSLLNSCIPGEGTHATTKNRVRASV